MYGVFPVIESCSIFHATFNGTVEDSNKKFTQPKSSNNKLTTTKLSKSPIKMSDTELDIKEPILPIATPLLSEKKAKNFYKLVKKGLKKKRALRGIKAVNKSLRKNRPGIVVIAADSSPLDIVSHLPELAHEKGVPVVWVPSKKELGASCMAKRPCCAVMCIRPDENEDIRELYDKCLKIAENASDRKSVV